MAGAFVCRQNGSGAISATQFLGAFQQAWAGSRVTGLGTTRSLPRRLGHLSVHCDDAGIAVSGGADSMALAYLCKQLVLKKTLLVDDDDDGYGFTVKAFVVDHKAREESSREARTVAGWLRDIGISTSILELEWPSPDSVSKLSAFETHARRLRFQALGQACRDNRIETLLMGHHRDDNVETTLWRLCSGARGAGLTGIPQVARIPECHGLYGVSESGLVAVLRGKQLISSSSSSEGGGGGRKDRPPLRVDESKNEAYMHLNIHSPQQENRENIIKDTLPTATGGIFICRPLLSVPKTRLIDTCNENNIPFVTDPTNFDPTLTPRNAIRSLLSSKRLPRALEPPSILSLIQRSQDLVREASEASDQLLKECRLLEFNGRAGAMLVRFPSSPEQTEDAAGDEKTSRTCKIQIQAMTLRRITELISPFPENHFPLKSFEKFVERVFPSDHHYHHHHPPPLKTQQRRQAFTVGGVMFRPVVNTTTNDDNNDADTTWLLSRQPYMRHRLPEVRLDVPVPVPQQQQDRAEGPDYNYTPWTLWDNRYWLRLKLVPNRNQQHRDAATGVADKSHPQPPNTTTTIPITIRPFQPTDLQKIHQSLKQSDSSNPSSMDMDSLQSKLSHSAPGHIRFTLPMLTTTEQPLALPTLDIRIPATDNLTIMSNHGSFWSVKWQWTYKMIDPEVLRLMGWLEDCETITPE
ncbi:hypothetical protein VTN00DRAFT_4302 [Thermoascus crustaceus]|uniref:uncharacterized protein n=1 Tax=Thermoascus crustaceus TaxID=5088 RepID=UPI0037421AE3